MKLSNVLATALTSLTNASCTNTTDKPQEVSVLAAEGLRRLQAYYSNNTLPNPETCTLDNVAVRREW